MKLKLFFCILYAFLLTPVFSHASWSWHEDKDEDDRCEIFHVDEEGTIFLSEGIRSLSNTDPEWIIYPTKRELKKIKKNGRMVALFLSKKIENKWDKLWFNPVIGGNHEFQIILGHHRPASHKGLTNLPDSDWPVRLWLTEENGDYRVTMYSKNFTAVAVANGNEKDMTPFLTRKNLGEMINAAQVTTCFPLVDDNEPFLDAMLGTAASPELGLNSSASFSSRAACDKNTILRKIEQHINIIPEGIPDTLHGGV